tara:strand:+ start:2775 stop:4067 length:1293 start_codon:yes stop_codon:yes gene_type:complete
MADFYTDRTIVFWREWANSTNPPQCPEGSHYYRLFAKKANATNRIRGDEGVSSCCEECELCQCWCNSAYIWGTGSSQQDASFDSQYDGAGNPEYSDINVTLTGITTCRDPGGGGCLAWVYDNWGSISINGTYSCEWVGTTGAPYYTCTWQYRDDWRGPIEGCEYQNVVTFTVNFSNGDFKVAAGVLTRAAEGESCACGEVGETLFSSASGIKPNCSSGSVTIDNATVCDDAGSPYFGDGSAQVSWGTQSHVTPDFYTATFTGTIVPCIDADPRHATTCPFDNAVRAAIEKLKDPSGVVLYNTIRGVNCSWTSPYFQVPGHPTWYWRVGLGLHDAEANTKWTVEVTITNLGHPHDEGDVGGIPGLKYNCISDRDTHSIFSGEAFTVDESCDSPPAISNNNDCTDAHACGDPPAPDNYSPCASGGSVSLTAG